MTAQLQQVVDTFVDITNSQTGLSMDDATLRALLICCDTARLAQGVLIELLPSRDEYVVTATRSDLARLYEDSGPMLDDAWTVIDQGREISRTIDYSNLPTSEVAMTLKLIGAKSIHQFPVKRKAEVIGILVLLLESRVLIEQAKGVIAERYSMSQPDAFTWLRSLARNERGKLRDVAQRIVMSTSQSPALGGIGLHSDLVDSAGR